MREIVLDTETTGLDPLTGDRIVEIGAIELHNHVATGKVYHQYINPERDMPQDAYKVHGLSEAFLSDKPVFAAIVTQFRDFISDAKLVIHNAAFDMKFINAEFERAGVAPLPMDQAVDTLDIARRKFPGSNNSLDGLCKRFGVDNSGRQKHGALLDSELLADVYLELMGGQQTGMQLRIAHSSTGDADDTTWRAQPRAVPLSPWITSEEESAHAAFIEKLGAGALWKTL